MVFNNSGISFHKNQDHKNNRKNEITPLQNSNPSLFLIVFSWTDREIYIVENTKPLGPTRHSFLPITLNSFEKNFLFFKRL